MDVISVEDAVAILKMDVQQLKSQLSGQGQPKSGSKIKLQERLMVALGSMSTTGERKLAEEPPKKRPRQVDSGASSGDVSESDDEDLAGSGAISTSGGIVESLVDADWSARLAGEFEKPYFKECLKQVAAARKAGPVWPPDHEVFAALNACPLSQVKVVIIGQDPYFNPDQGHGLCFSVVKGVKIPPSLMRIYRELEQDIPGFKVQKHGYLMEWAQRGVLLLNATLTVNQGKANSHKKFGWQRFTDELIKIVSDECKGVVFLLWGGFAQKKGKKIIDRKKHHVIEGPHPSPMSGSAWKGCKHFSKCNKLLKADGKEPIDWTISK